jgi:hypothetical protein
VFLRCVRGIVVPGEGRPGEPAAGSVPSCRARRRRRSHLRRRLDSISSTGSNEDLLTERPTLAIPRLCHNAQADLVRKQQVLGSNPSVGSTPFVRAQEEQLSGVSSVLPAGEALLTDEDLLTGRVRRRNVAIHGLPWPKQVAGCP